MADIGRLVCGEPLSEGIAKSALQQLSQSINSFAERAVEILKQDAADEARALGPFFASFTREFVCGPCGPLGHVSDFVSQ
jgi:hypothetical protein